MHVWINMKTIREDFQSKIDSLNETGGKYVVPQGLTGVETSLKDDFQMMLDVLNEEAGRGSGPQGVKGVKRQFDKMVKFVAYDFLNLTSIFGKREKYNFNNYYSLDIRLKPDLATTSFNDGFDTYAKIFDELYKSMDGDALMKLQLQRAYIAAMRDNTTKNTIRDHFLKVTGEGETEVQKSRDKFEKIDHEVWKKPLSEILSKDRYKVIRLIYDTLPTISIVNSIHLTKEDVGESVNADAPKASDPKIALKHEKDNPNSEDGFVSLIMNGFSSAIKGHVPQGVTLEEMIQGKFSRKAISPEQGTFINRVKDPTSDKPFTFRSQDSRLLEELHNVIMKTFKLDSRLKEKLPETRDRFRMTLALNRSDLVLYLTQDDFNRVEKGGEGFANVLKGIWKYLGDAPGGMVD